MVRLWLYAAAWGAVPLGQQKVRDGSEMSYSAGKEIGVIQERAPQPFLDGAEHPLLMQALYNRGCAASKKSPPFCRARMR